MLGPPVVFFYSLLGEGSPTEIDSRKKLGYQLILTSLLEDLVSFPLPFPSVRLWPWDYDHFNTRF